jgi:hypothetical protein
MKPFPPNTRIAQPVGYCIRRGDGPLWVDTCRERACDAWSAVFALLGIRENPQREAQDRRRLREQGMTVVKVALMEATKGVNVP